MPRNDGSIRFSVNIDSKDAQEELKLLQSEMDELKARIEDDKRSEGATAAWIQQLNQQLDEANRRLFEMKAAGKDAFSADEIAYQKETVKALEASLGAAEKKAARLSERLEKNETALQAAEYRSGELEKQITAAASASGKMAAAVGKAQKSADKFKSRLKEIVRSALIFTVISQGLAALRNWVGDVINANEEARRSMAQLKGALLTLVQPLVGVIIPAFTQLVGVLTALVGRLASLTASLFGATAGQASQAAEALNGEIEALEGTGEAAKKAAQSLAGFDEINTLSSGADQNTDAAMTAPDFNWAATITPQLQQIADAVLLIGIGFGLWRLSDKLPGKLSTISSTLGGIVITVGGLMLLWDGFSDAMENGVDWSNLITMLLGTAAAAAGLFLVFGKTGSAIGLLVGGIALLISGFKDIVANGANLQNMLAAIAGIIGTGLGIALLTGSLIPAVIAGIAAIVLAIAGLTGNADQLIGNLKDVFGGLADFIANIINGDINAAFEGLKRSGKGLVNTLLTIGGSLFNFLIKGLNWLISKINTISFSVPDWVPLVGGKSVGFNIRPVSEWPIPQLATGAVIPPNREFLAVLGDQRSGNNIEAPEGLIRQLIREETGMNTELLQAILEAIRAGQTIVMDGEKVARNQVRHINNMSIAAGKPVLWL